MIRRFAFLSAALSLSLIATKSYGQDAPPLNSLEQLRASSSPGLVVIERSGNPAWVGSLHEPAPGRTPSEMARNFLLRHSDLVGDHSVEDFQTLAVQDHGGTTFVRLQPTYRGLPLLGAQLIISVRDGMVRHVARTLETLGAPQEGQIISADAAARAVRDWSGGPAESPTEQAWLPLTETLVPVWIVEQRELRPPRHWRYLVDATTGAVLWRFDQFLRDDGYVYDTNPWVTDGEYTRVELTDLESDEVLEGTYARAYQCIGMPEDDCTTYDGPCRQCGLREHFATADEEGNYLYLPSEPNLTDSFAEVQAYYHVTRFSRWIEETFDYPMSCRGRRSVDIHVNYNIPGDENTSANAFYGDSDGDLCGDITMGEGLGVDMAYDADVIYHEFSHGVVAATGGLGCGYMGVCIDDLGLDWSALGLNEGFADYFSSTFTGDPRVGEHSGAAFGREHDGIRNGENQNICPFDLIGESHYDGQIWLGVGWDLREALGAEVTDWLMFHALQSMPNNAGYDVAAAALQEAADQAQEQGLLDDEGRLEIERILGPEGRRIADCRRIIPLDDVPEGHADEHLVLYSYMGAALPTSLQWSITSPRRAQELRFWVEEGDARADWMRAHVRIGEPVGITLDTSRGLRVTYTDDYMIPLEDNEFVLTPDSDPPLEEDTVYYVVIETMCRRGCQILPRGEISGLPNNLPVAEAGEDIRVEVGTTVELDGGESSDIEDDELTFAWSRIGGPRVELDDADEEVATFVPEVAGMHSIQLTVTDEEGGRDEAMIYVTAFDPEPETRLNVSGGGVDCSCNTTQPRAPEGLGRLLSLF